jgi:hypothetical protein
VLSRTVLSQSKKYFVYQLAEYNVRPVLRLLLRQPPNIKNSVERYSGRNAASFVLVVFIVQDKSIFNRWLRRLTIVADIFVFFVLVMTISNPESILLRRTLVFAVAFYHPSESLRRCGLGPALLWRLGRTVDDGR